MLKCLKTRIALNYPIPLLLLTLSLAVSGTAYSSEQGWILEREEDRIKVYTRPESDSPFLAVKVTAVINAPFEKVVEAMGSGDGCGEWRAVCKSSEIMSTVSETENYVYMVLDLPWPISDRDMVIHSDANIDLEAKTVTVNLVSASSSHPEQDYVRAESNGQYLITAIADEQVEFTYIMHTDFGGDLSPDIINTRLSTSTYDDIKQLQELAEK
jgi:hypothetical protein